MIRFVRFARSGCWRDFRGSPMSFELTPTTEAGKRFVAAAQRLRPTLLERADQADRTSTLCRDNFEDLARAGVTGAFVPEELGGFGLASIHDWIVGIAALARGDASTAIATNMHLAICRAFAHAYNAAGSVPPGDPLREQLSAVAAGRMLICATATEAGTDNLHPLTEATRVADGWRIDGTKLFVTLSPAATHLGMNLRIRDGGQDQIATSLLPIDTPGIVPQDDWDALGMRGSGSQSVRFDNVRVPDYGVRALAPWGQWSVAMLMNRALANLPLVGAFLGIAEAAHAIALEAVASGGRRQSSLHTKPGVHHHIAELEIELAQCRSILQRTGVAVDEFLGVHGVRPPLEAAHQLMKDYQLAKWVVNRGAIEIVGKAMDLVGGASFMAGHPLARLYRDVRAGPFMQPYSPSEARQYIGQVALGLLPKE